MEWTTQFNIIPLFSLFVVKSRNSPPGTTGLDVLPYRVLQKQYIISAVWSSAPHETPLGRSNEPQNPLSDSKWHPKSKWNGKKPGFCSPFIRCSSCSLPIDFNSILPHQMFLSDLSHILDKEMRQKGVGSGSTGCARIQLVSFLGPSRRSPLCRCKMRSS